MAVAFVTRNDIRPEAAACGSDRHIRRQQVLAEQFGQTRGHRVGDKHCFLRQRASETEVVRECLQAGAFAQRKWPVLRWVDELRVGTARNRFRRLAWHQTSQSSRRSATPFAWRPVHHAPVRTAPVGVVPQTLRQVLHRLAWDAKRSLAPRPRPVALGSRDRPAAGRRPRCRAAAGGNPCRASWMLGHAGRPRPTASAPGTPAAQCVTRGNPGFQPRQPRAITRLRCCGMP